MKELTLEITNNCSLYCLQCSTQAFEKGNIYWTLDDVKFYLDKFKDFDHIRILGDEPF